MRKHNKYLLIAILILAAGTSVSAAILRNPVKKGRFITGGALSLSSVSSGLLNTAGGSGGTYLSAYPYLQYFVADGWALGGEMLIETNSLGNNDYAGIGIGPVLKYFYHTSMKHNFYPYTGISFLPGYFNDSGSKTEFTQIDFALFAGNIFMIGTNSGFDVRAAYSLRSQFPNSGSSVSGGVFNFFIGFAIFL